MNKNEDFKKDIQSLREEMDFWESKRRNADCGEDFNEAGWELLRISLLISSITGEQPKYIKVKGVEA